MAAWIENPSQRMQRAPLSPHSLLPLRSPARMEVSLPQHPHYCHGGHQHQLWPGAPTELAGTGHPWGDRPVPSLPVHPTPPFPAPHCHWCSHPTPRLGVPGTALRTSAYVPLPCPPCCLPKHRHPALLAPVLSSEVLVPWHCVCRVALRCARAPPATLFSLLAAANPSP